MNAVPGLLDWDTSDLHQEQRAYLDQTCPFEEIANASVAEAEVFWVGVEPCEDSAPGMRDARRIVYGVRVGKRTFDLLYNGRDGLRGRYYQGVDPGNLATRHLINLLKPKLLKSICRDPARSAGLRRLMTLVEVEASLDASSAKIWPRERDDAGNSRIAPNATPQLKVPRWAANEGLAGSKGPLWRWTPYHDEIEVKGAFLRPDGFEYVPAGKRDRSYHIHRYGYT